MIELLSAYSLEQIIIFIVIFLLAIKEVFTLTDWLKEKIKKHFNKENDSNEFLEALKQKNAEQDNQIQTMIDFQNKMSQDISSILLEIQNLTSSDRESIKSFITKEHHHFCYEVGWIDDYNLDCIEKRFARYQKEGGNSFIASLVEEIRSLPRQPRNERNNE